VFIVHVTVRELICFTSASKSDRRSLRKLIFTTPSNSRRAHNRPLIQAES